MLLSIMSQTAPAIASKYGNRWFGMSQENCLYAVNFLLCRNPPPSSQFLLDIVKHKPDVIDKLLDCSAVPICPWYPENNFDSAGKPFRSLAAMK